MDFKKYIEDIKDFPEEGIIFRDVTPLLKDKEAYKESIDTFAKWIDGLGVQVDVVAGPEARGFLFGCPVAYKVNAGFVPVRKPGKLPGEVERFEYDLEYGSNILEKMKFIFMPIVSNLVKMLLLLMIYLLQVEQLKQLFNLLNNLVVKL